MKEDFILKVIEQFEKGDAVVLQIKTDGCKLLLKKEGAFPKKENAYAVPQVFPTVYQPFNANQAILQENLSEGSVPQQAVNPQSLKQNVSVQNEDADTSNTSTEPCFEIKSPLVGTFYRAPSPDSPPYVEKGSKVKKGQPLCVLEAMKMMNTLECEYDGTIDEILVSNGDLIEFDQVLFRIKAN